MLILLTGATGFIGSHLARALLERGHELRCPLRDPRRAPPGVQAVQADFARDQRPEQWLPHLQGVLRVVNAVGILQQRGEQSFEALHVRGPQALFEACARSSVRRVVQISALGADAGAASRYHLSKRQADDTLLALPLNAVVVQPSLVFGLDGASARLFVGLAALPVIPVLAGGRQALQPIHIDDLVRCLVALVEGDACSGQRVPLVGAQPLLLREYLAALRESGLGLRRARFASLPRPLVEAAARIGTRTGALLDVDSWRMLERGNTASVEHTRALLGRLPRLPAEFIAAHERPQALTLARLGWALPLLRASVAALWIFTGIVSLGIYPVEESYRLLARTGVPPAWAPIALYGAALLDLLLGVLSLLRPRRWLWQAQIVLMLGYTVIITLRLPEYWLHPYGPLTKNLPLLAALLLLVAFEKRR